MSCLIEKKFFLIEILLIITNSFKYILILSGIVTTQINVRISDAFLDNVKEHAKIQGYLNLQEYIREAIREKMFNELEVRKDYLKKLRSKEATTFLSKKNSKKFYEELKSKALNTK